MPLGPDVKYRWKTNPDGSKVRLAFKGNTVIETKPQGRQAKMARLSAQGRKSAMGSGPFSPNELRQGYKVLSTADPTAISEIKENA